MTNKIAITSGLFLLVLVCGCGDERADAPAPPPADTEMKKIEDAFEAVKGKYSRSILSLVRDAGEYGEKMKEAKKADNKEALWEYRKALAGTMQEIAEQKRTMCVKMEDALDGFEKMPEEKRRKYLPRHIIMLGEVLTADSITHPATGQTAYPNFSLRRTKKLCALLEQAVETDAQIDLMKEMRGFVMFECSTENEKLLRTVMKHRPDMPEMKPALAGVLVLLGRFDEAIDILEKISPENDAEAKDIKEVIEKFEQYRRYWESEKEYVKEDEEKKAPRVRLKTTRGDIIVELFQDDAPNTVDNFISLVEKGFYNETLFHRSEGWVVQGGDPLGCGIGGPGYCIKTETVGNRRRHFLGYMGMARGEEKDTEGSQFYFVRCFRPRLDEGEYTVFGRIVEGMDVMLNLEQGDKITEATFVNKHEHEGRNFTPETIPE
ncbi:MAG: peptidylprolyl isomerase [Planctomycetota bacterium]